jgi:transcriptional regulator with XRE-family HTH domain
MSEEFPHYLNVAEFLTRRIAELDKTQRQISEEAGFDNPNIITMFKNGDTKVPINRVARLAKALEVDSAHLLRLVMRDYAPDLWEEVEDIMKSTILTPGELNLLRAIREVTEYRGGAHVIFGRDLTISIHSTTKRRPGL